MKKLLVIFFFVTTTLLTFADNIPQLSKSSVKEVVAAMTIEEKANVIVGALYRARTDTMVIVRIADGVPGVAGCTNAIPRLGIPSIVLADGPAGLRMDAIRQGDSNTYYCTHFPIGTLLACSWNQPLVENVGKAIGNEVLEYGVDVLLAPALNIQRNPLCGRNFEYYSEDPVVSGKIAAAYIRGLQSNGVGASVKHFAANSQETNRMLNDSRVSQRALRELYLKGFEIAVSESDPWTVMTSYNKLNGTFTSEDADLIETLLRGEWGYKGVVMTDWFAGTNAISQVKAGNDMIQPGIGNQIEAIVEGVQNGKLDETLVDRNVERILNLILLTPQFKKYSYSNKPDLKTHAAVTRQSATEGMVLLKNDKNTLPLAANRHVALFGCTSYDFIAGGTGSGNVNRAYTISLQDGLKNAGYEINSTMKNLYEKQVADEKTRITSMNRKWFMPEIRPDELKLDKEIIDKVAAESDLAIITIGRNSGECFDRTLADYKLNEDEMNMIENVCNAYHTVDKRVIVILNVGGIIEMSSWNDNPDAILCAWQGGQEGGNSVADILSGKVSPSGKLTMTFPIQYTDVPSADNFPINMTASLEVVNKKETHTNLKNMDYTLYEEGIYVGYRYYDSFKKEVAYPFGYGLSYTLFEYSNANMQRNGDEYIVSVKVKNVGNCAGKEVVQLYVTAPQGALNKPEKELKAFAKTTELQPGEAEEVTLTVKNADLASFCEQSSAWITDAGQYKFCIGASSKDIRSILEVYVDTYQKEVSDILKPQEEIDNLKQ